MVHAPNRASPPSTVRVLRLRPRLSSSSSQLITRVLGLFRTPMIGRISPDSNGYSLSHSCDSAPRSPPRKAASAAVVHPTCPKRLPLLPDPAQILRQPRRELALFALSIALPTLLSTTIVPWYWRPSHSATTPARTCKPRSSPHRRLHRIVPLPCHSTRS